MTMSDSLSLLIIFLFFFSSRRRHTRLQGDWSSDVCSSDLPTGLLYLTNTLSHVFKSLADYKVYILLSGRWFRADRKSVVEGKSVDLGGRRIIKKKKTTTGMTV